MSPQRILLPFLVLVMACSVAAVTPVTPKLWRTLKKGTDGVPAADGGDGGRRRAPWIELAADAKTLEEIWEAQAPGKPGDVDFKSETVIFLLLGVQSSGGYAIEPRSVDPPVNGVVRVHAKLIQPMDDAPTTSALTAPYAVISVRARGIAKVEWVDDDGRLLATRLAE